MARWNGKIETFHLDQALFKDCITLFPEDNFDKDSSPRSGEENNEKAHTLGYWLSQGTILVNLIVMLFIWLSIAVNWYMSSFLINQFEDVNLTGVSMYGADLLVGLFLIKFSPYFSLKPLLFSLFVMCTGSGCVILAYGLNHQTEVSFFILIILSRIGCTGAFILVYIGH